MSRDATGISTRIAIRTTTCAVCRSGRGEPCDLDFPGDVENATHFQRLLDAPPYAGDPEWVEAIGVFHTVLGHKPRMTSRGMAITDALPEWAWARMVDVCDFLRGVKAQPREDDKILERAREAKAAAEKEIRDRFQGKYGAFWKCAKCGSYIVSSHLGSLPYRTQCLECRGTDLVRVGYAAPSP